MMIGGTSGVFEFSKVTTFRKDEIGFGGSRSMVNMFISGGY